MDFNKKDYFVLENKNYGWYCDAPELDIHYLIIEKESFSIGNGFYSIDEDEFKEVKGALKKELLSIAKKFDDTKKWYKGKKEQKIDKYNVKKYKDVKDVLVYLTEIKSYS